MEKGVIRKKIFERRKSLKDEDLQKDSHRIAEKIFSMDCYRNAKTVYLYIGCKGEVGTVEIMEAALRDGKKVAAPRVFGEDMRYFYITSQEDLEPGYFQIPEPKITLPEAEDEEALLLVPGVAFDRDCHRCGYGKGFYDRYLSVHTRHRCVALALDFQIMEEVPIEPFDVLPDMVVTPAAIFKKREG